jgi:hypothetical protein
MKANAKCLNAGNENGRNRVYHDSITVQLFTYESDLSNCHDLRFVGLLVLCGVASRAEGLHILGRRGGAAVVLTRARLKSR